MSAWKPWKRLKGFWRSNFIGNFKKISERIGTFLVTVIDLFIPVIGFYIDFISPKVWGNFLFGCYIAFAVLFTGCVMRIMKNGFQNGDLSAPQ